METAESAFLSKSLRSACVPRVQFVSAWWTVGELTESLQIELNQLPEIVFKILFLKIKRNPNIYEEYDLTRRTFVI